MIEDLEIETYLSISPSFIGIYLFDIKNLKNLHKQELKFDNKIGIIDLNNLNEFLESNIFKIEKLSGKFIKNIFLVINDNKLNNVCFGVKKKIYEDKINKKYLENLLTDGKDLFKENYQEEKIMHMTINKYLIDGNNYSLFQDNISGENFCLELGFRSISQSFANEIEQILEKYHIQITKYIDQVYVKDLFNKQDLGLAEMIYKTKSGFNENEVQLIPKNLRKPGFFEKFFQLFS